MITRRVLYHCATTAAHPGHFLYFWSQGVLQTMTVHINGDWTFPHRSVVFISGFFSQREGVLGRYHHCLVTVHQRVPLTQFARLLNSKRRQIQIYGIAGDRARNLQIRWKRKQKGRVALSSVILCMVATDLRKGLAVAMTSNLNALEQPRSVYIHQSSRASASLTALSNQNRLVWKGLLYKWP